MPLPDPGQSASPDCEIAGHDWRDAGGGLMICAVCELTEWEEVLLDQGGAATDYRNEDFG